jgi:hypothetical protein
VLVTVAVVEVVAPAPGTGRSRASPPDVLRGEVLIRRPVFIVVLVAITPLGVRTIAAVAVTGVVAR